MSALPCIAHSSIHSVFKLVDICNVGLYQWQCPFPGSTCCNSRRCSQLSLRFAATASHAGDPLANGCSCTVTSQSSRMSSEVLKRILEAGKVTGATVVLATNEEVPLSTIGTGALNSLLALFTEEAVTCPLGTQRH